MLGESGGFTQGWRLELENRSVIALVVNEPKIGDCFQPMGQRTGDAAAPFERHRYRLPNDSKE